MAMQTQDDLSGAVRGGTGRSINRASELCTSFRRPRFLFQLEHPSVGK